MKSLSHFITEGLFGKASDILSEEVIRMWLEENCKFEATWGKDPTPQIRKVGSGYMVDADVVIFPDKKIDTLNGNGLFRWGSVGYFKAFDKPSLTSSIGIPEEADVVAFWGNRKVDRLEGFSKTTKIGKLDLDGCIRLASLKGMAGKVDELCIRRTSIKTLEGICEVRQLVLEGCSKLESLEGAPSYLARLNLAYCDKLTTLDGIIRCNRLTLSNNTSLQSVGTTLEHVDTLELYPGVPPKVRQELRKLEKERKIDTIKIRR